MEVIITQQDGVNVVTLVGEIDGQSAPVAQAQILPLAIPDSGLIMDMTEVVYMSSAGLRMMVLLYRQFTAQNGKIVLVGLSEGIQDTMSATGFLNFFVVSETYEAGLKAIGG